MEPNTTRGEKKYWMVIRTDTNNNTFFVKNDFDAETSARDYIHERFLSGKKPHGQDYYAIPYTKSTYAAVLKKHKVLE